mmetsp:Transcript_4829/g.8756  ORF Transcript_4829/g.8756 Transcript_4829/m.8756 type:complete len:232 (-) Transcript_4829:31-726(-)
MLNNAGEFPSNAQVVIAPTALHTGHVLKSVRKDVNVSVQNVFYEPKAGAWTGELTVDLVRDFGVNWTLAGHSERRSLRGETPEMVGKVVKVAIEAGMNVIACIGEQLEDRQGGKTMDVLKTQLEPIISAVGSTGWGQVVVAYEPVWAIGTGVTASPEQAQDTHKEIRAYLSEKVGADTAKALRIIYGGSVKAANCEDLIKREDIDGFLVGGASMNTDFLKIINSSALKSKI